MTQLTHAPATVQRLQTWLDEHRLVWRTAGLVLLLIALFGPLGYDRIHVPREYPCTLPNIRLSGDFCGIPMSIYALVTNPYASWSTQLLYIPLALVGVFLVMWLVMRRADLQRWALPYLAVLVAAVTILAVWNYTWVAILLPLLFVLTPLSTLVVAVLPTHRPVHLAHITILILATISALTWTFIITYAELWSIMQAWGGGLFLSVVAILLVLELLAFTRTGRSEALPAGTNLGAT